ncbi:MAG: hypothetical protein ACPGUV_05960 [Polyangiales bacterium]
MQDAEHRGITRAALLPTDKAHERFAERTARLRTRMRSHWSTTALIRADRDRDA